MRAGAYDNATYQQVTAGLYPNYTTIHHNWLYKDLKWNTITYTKNLIEQKNGKHTRIYENVGEYSFEGRFSQGQHGLGFAIANRVRGGRGTGDTAAATPWASTQFIEIDHNILRHVNTAFAVQAPLDPFYCQDIPGNGPNNYAQPCTEQALITASAADGAGRGTDWSIHDNYADDLDSGKYGTYYPSPAFTNTTSSQGVRGQGGDNFHLQYNTFRFANQPAGAVIPSGTYLGIAYPSHTVSNSANAGWDSTADNRDFDGNGPVTDTAGAGAQSKWIASTGLLVEGNDFGWEIFGVGVYGLEALHGYSGQGWQANIFRNNNIQNSFSGDWAAKAAAANADAPGQYTGNTVNTSPSSSQGVRNLSALLALEPGIRSGNR